MIDLCPRCGGKLYPHTAADCAEHLQRLLWMEKDKVGYLTRELDDLREQYCLLLNTKTTIW